MQLSQQVSYLLCIGPGFDPRDNHPGWQVGLLLLLLSSEKKKWQLSSEAVTSARSARGNGDMKELRHQRST